MESGRIAPLSIPQSPIKTRASLNVAQATQEIFQSHKARLKPGWMCRPGVGAFFLSIPQSPIKTRLRDSGRQRFPGFQSHKARLKPGPALAPHETARLSIPQSPIKTRAPPRPLRRWFTLSIPQSPIKTPPLAPTSVQLLQRKLHKISASTDLLVVGRRCCEIVRRPTTRPL